MLAAALAGGAVHAAEADHIDTDGPDFVESSESVGAGRFQFEAGPSLQFDRRSGALARTLTTPVLLKQGVQETVELRLETDGAVFAHAPGGPASTGFADTALGFKWHAADADPSSGRPSTAWIAHVELPSGAAAERGRSARPSLRTVLTWPLEGGWSLGLMPGVRMDTRADGGAYAEGILGLVAGRWWTARLRSFVEVSAPRIAAARDGGTELYGDAGAAWLLDPDWQIGARIGWALNRNTPSRYLLVSIAARF